MQINFCTSLNHILVSSLSAASVRLHVSQIAETATHSLCFDVRKLWVASKWRFPDAYYPQLAVPVRETKSQAVVL